METERVIFLEGKNVILRPLEKETDLLKAVRWMNNDEVRYFIARYLPVSRDEEGDWFDGLKNREKDIVLAIEMKKTREFIGVIGIHRIDFHNRTATTGTVIGEKKFWGKGYGTEAKMLLLRYAFEELNLHKICSGAIEYNKRSLAYSKKCGYRVEGVLKKQFFKKGKYRDEVLLAVFKEDWKKAWNIYRRKQ